MYPFVILTDSTADLDRETREQYGIEYVAMRYVVDEREYVASLDWETHDPRTFYDMMRNGTRITTTQVPREVYLEKFTEILEAGRDVVYLSCSSALSGSINVASVVAGEVMERYPGRRVFCVDSLISSLGQGGLAILAAQRRDEGMDAAQVAQWLEQNRLRMNQCGYCDSLEYLRRAGRVTASSAFFGNLLGVRPLLISDALGQNLAVKKAKGAVNARKETALLLKEQVIDPEGQSLYISHADDLPAAEALRDAILKEIPFGRCHIGTIGPIVGSSVGPGTLIAFCMGKEVTANAK